MTTRFRCDTQPATIRNALFLLLLLILAVPAQLQAAPLVTARYVQVAGQEVMAEISIGAPPPPTLIVIQNLPPQVAVLRAQPETKSVSIDKGEVKWLLTGLKPGNYTLHLTLDQPVSKSAISGEIRYREPGGGMISLPIAMP